MVPSTVLLDPGHLSRPILLPTMDACNVPPELPRIRHPHRTINRRTAHHCVPDTEHQHPAVPVDPARLQPDSVGASRQEVEMAEYHGPRVL